MMGQCESACSEDVMFTVVGLALDDNLSACDLASGRVGGYAEVAEDLDFPDDVEDALITDTVA